MKGGAWDLFSDEGGGGSADGGRRDAEPGLHFPRPLGERKETLVPVVIRFPPGAIPEHLVSAPGLPKVSRVGTAWFTSSWPVQYVLCPHPDLPAGLHYALYGSSAGDLTETCSLAATTRDLLALPLSKRVPFQHLGARTAPGPACTGGLEATDWLKPLSRTRVLLCAGSGVAKPGERGVTGRPLQGPAGPRPDSQFQSTGLTSGSGLSPRPRVCPALLFALRGG